MYCTIKKNGEQAKNQFFFQGAALNDAPVGV
jgi:hypothetical protein